MKLTQEIIDQIQKHMEHTKLNGDLNWLDGDNIEVQIAGTFAADRFIVMKNTQKNRKKLLRILIKNNLCATIWNIWKYSLGSFQDNTTKKYDNIVCIIRSFIFLQLVITNCFIVAGNIRHWNDHHTPPYYEHIRD